MVVVGEDRHVEVVVTVPLRLTHAREGEREELQNHTTAAQGFREAISGPGPASMLPSFIITTYHNVHYGRSISQGTRPGTEAHWLATDS